MSLLSSFEFIDYVKLLKKYSIFGRSKFYGIFAPVVCENLKLNNKPKTRKQKIVRWALSIVVCVCVEYGILGSMKTQKSTINLPELL